MRRKPNGPKYQNLTARGGVIYYERVAGARRIRFSCETDDWSVAAAVRAEFEQRKGIGRIPFHSAEAPRLREFADRYLAEDTAHLAPTTRGDRPHYLREDGPLLRFLGERKLDAKRGFARGRRPRNREYRPLSRSVIHA